MLVVPPLPSDWPEIADQAAEDAESLFWDSVKELEGRRDGDIEVFWPPLETLDEEEDW
jgi:hypothetical protein